jgi:protein gp37
MPKKQFKAFKEDISGLGVLEPITLIDGMILDGRHRYKACKELGIECPTRTVDNVSPHDLVRSMNLHRRHLTQSQMSMVGAALLEPFEQDAKKEQGKRTDLEPDNITANLPKSKGRKSESVDKAGEAVGVSGRSIRDAKVILDSGTPEEIESVVEGEKAVSAVAKKVRQRRPQVEEVQPKAKKGKKIIFNETNANIGWAAYSWNPVTGCKHGCDYCYAAAMSKRYDWSFNPQLHEDRLGHTGTKLKSGKNNRVFTCSMGELFGPWVPDEWIEKVFHSVRQNPEWTFLFLTKSPERLPELDWPENSWIGATVDTQRRVDAVADAFTAIDDMDNGNLKFISCEPLLEHVKFTDSLLDSLDWLIIGAKSDNGKKVQPDCKWVKDLFVQADDCGIPVWFKDNLIFRPQEVPS